MDAVSLPQEDDVSDPYIGEIKIWAMNWAPRGWAFCNGASMLVQQNAALFSLIGNAYGGDGKVTFFLPDLRGRTPVCTDYRYQDYLMGKAGGVEAVVLTAGTTPAHAHEMMAVPSNGTALPAAGAYAANLVSSATSGGSTFNVYQPGTEWTANTQLAPGSISTTGSGAAHGNIQPFAVVNFTICISGSYPQRN